MIAKEEVTKLFLKETNVLLYLTFYEALLFRALLKAKNLSSLVEAYVLTHALNFSKQASTELRAERRKAKRAALARYSYLYERDSYLLI